MSETWTISNDRYFDPEPSRRGVARQLYKSVRGAAIVSPHGHVNPGLLADPEATLGTPTDLFIIPDHYVFRMLYSRGIPLESLGIPGRKGVPVEEDHRKIWQLFAENFYLFRGTPTGLWLSDELTKVFGVEEKLTGESGQRIYDHLQSRLMEQKFSPRALFAQFNIEVLCTTDGAADPLKHHRRLNEEGWKHRIRPTIRPDAVMAVADAGWLEAIEDLAEASGTDIVNYRSFVQALEARRSFFRDMGAVATDHSALTPYTQRLTDTEVEAIFARALSGDANEEDAARFNAHMLVELARMSVEDGLVMQLHVGSLRGHNMQVAERFGPDKGADIPLSTEWTRSLRPLLNEYGNDARFRLILFTLDESTYARELAPLAGHYPALLLGAPWWFYDSPGGMRRYLDQTTETAGIYNLAGFNDDTRAFVSIPARHDMWRRVTCDWLAGMVVSGILDDEDAAEMASDLSYRLAREAYGLDEETSIRSS